jgi:hypothetical protein
MSSLKRCAFCVAIYIVSIGSVWPQTTTFTYQGKLNDGANPANGNYDIQFKLFDTPTVGTGVQQGSTITNGSVAVGSGVFAVQLDFGLPAFGGPPRYLEIAVRPAGSPNAYTVLGPRSPVSSAPYSVRSLNSSVADTLSSACVGCVTSTQIGAGSGNYVQNTLTPQNANFSIVGNGSANILTANQFNIGANRVLGKAPTSIFVGQGAGLSNTTGNGNTFVGENAGVLNTTGGTNSFFGLNAGQANNAVDNAFFGAFSGNANSTGAFNSFFGSRSGVFNTTGFENAFFGANSGFHNIDAAHNAFFGSWSGYTNTIGDDNAFFGANAGRSNLDGIQNVFVGSSAGYASTSGSYNVFVGQRAGRNNTTGHQNTFVGHGSGNDNVGGNFNSFLGYGTGQANTSGQMNSLVGFSAGYSNTTGQFNSFFGVGAGDVNTTGSSNTIIGATANLASANLSYATAIGAESMATLSNSIYLGRPNGADVVRIPGAVVIDGTLVVGALGSAGSTSICLNAVNRISPCSSSLRYKSNAQNFTGGLDLVRRLRPITFDWRDGGMHDVGFAAEEVNAIEPLLTTRNDKGEIEGVKYAQITTVLVNAIKEQQKIIERQQKRIDALTQLVCRSNPDAILCKE